MKSPRGFFRRNGLFLGCLLCVATAVGGGANPAATWLVDHGLSIPLAVLVFIASLLVINRVLLGLYQEFINRE